MKSVSTFTTFGTTIVSTIALVSVTSLIWFWREKKQQEKNGRQYLASAYEKLIGQTPLVRLDHLSEILQRNIYVKMENWNPGGTGKDRAALCMLQEAEKKGELPPSASRSNRISSEIELKRKHAAKSKPRSKIDKKNPNRTIEAAKHSTTRMFDDEFLLEKINIAMKGSRTGGLVIEGTSGSTGISLATLCASKGHACFVVLPNDQAPEKRNILETLGASVLEVRTAAISNPNHYVNIARRISLLAKQQGILAVFVNQFENLSNFRTHFETTAPELWKQAAGRIDAFCMSSGTGGTIGGVASSVKTRYNSKCRIVLVDPPGSALYYAIQHGTAFAPQQRERIMKRHRYDTIAEGIGLDRLTANFVRGQQYIDTAIRVTDQEAVDMAHWLLQTEGLWIGSSSAMNLVGAVRTALDLSQNSTVITVLCDSGQRHVTRFWNANFIRKWGLQWPPDAVENSRIPECLQNILVGKKKLTD